MNRWEKQLQSWTPRRPSAKIARRLFGRAERAPTWLRRAELWHWLTPAAACAMAAMIAVGGSNRHSPSLNDGDYSNFVATVMLSGPSGNLLPLLPPNQMDQNLQWNVWSRVSTPRETNLSDGSSGFQGPPLAPANR